MIDFEILTTSRFYLELKLDSSSDLIDGYFMECQGFKQSHDVIDICEVTPEKWGSNDSSVGRVVRTTIPGNLKSNNIILKHGMTISPTIWQWFNLVENGHWHSQRLDGDLTVYSQAGLPVSRFRFLKAWPVSYKISDQKADGNDFQVEEVELTVEKFMRVMPTGQEFPAKPLATMATEALG